LILAGVIVLLLVVLLVAPKFVDVNTYRGQIVAQLEQRLGRSVRLGAMELSALPSIRIRVDDVAIGDDPQFAQAEFVKAKSVKLRIGLWSLLRGSPQVSGIELTEPEVTLIKAKESKWNWSTLKPLQSAEKDASPAPFDLIARDGKFTLIDRGASPPVERRYTGVNVELDGYSPRQSFDFAVGLAIAGKTPGDKAGKMEISGEAGPVDDRDASLTPVDARVRMQDADLAGLESLLGVTSPRAGRLTMDVRVKGKLAEGVKAKGEIAADKLRLVEGVEPARAPVEADFSMTIKSEARTGGQSETSLAIDQGEVRLGKTKFTASGRINRIPNDPSVDLQIKGDGVALDSLLESAYAFGFGPPPGAKAGGAATANLHVIGDAKSMALDGRLEIRDLKFQSPSMPQAMTVSELKLSCSPQEIAAAPFRATLSKTAVDFNNLKIGGYGKQPRAHLDVATANAHLDDLLKIAESFGARPEVTGGGNVSLKASVDANLSGDNSPTTISGSGKLSGAKLQVARANKPVEVSNADLNFTGDSLRIDNLAAQLGSSQAGGWLQVKDFDHPLATFDLKANQINVTELQQAMGSAGGPGAAAQAKKPSNSIRAEGQLAVGKLILEGVTATDVQTKVTMAHQVITLDPLALKLFGGGYQGSAKIDQSQTPAEIALNGRFNGLDVNQVLSSSGQKSAIYGRADGALNIRGRGGDSSDALAKSLVGDGSVTISDGKFTSFDLMKQVEVLGKFANLPTGGAGTAFRSLKTNLRFDRGRMTTDAMQLVMDDLSVTGNGVMQLGDSPTVDYDLLARLSPAITKRVLPLPGGADAAGAAGGAGASSLLQSIGKITGALGGASADQSSLTLPLKMSGPIKQPSFGLNAALMGKQMKSNLINSLTGTSNKGANKDAGAGTGKDAAAPKPADLLKGVLGGFKGKGKP
jgi:AsmA protein